ncbi:ribose transport system ATP-binding protein [Roseovarius sp. MBR-78]|jgi:ribose transport system ATP-binding protein
MNMSTSDLHAPAAPVPRARETIAIRNVRKYFGPTRALDGVSFSASAGEVHAIVGGNGCGKSTLAKVISGILPVDSGSVSVLGEAPNTPGESRALGISTVYQEVMVADDSSVVDNIFLGADSLFARSADQEDRAERAATLMLDLTGEKIDPHGLVGNLPLGIKQWITIARGLLSEPRVLILDESSAALDFDSTERLFDKIRTLRDRGTTILIVTHRIAELVRISDRATVLRDGRDVGVLAGKEVTERNLLELMTGESQSETVSHAAAPQPESDELVMRAHGLSLAPGAQPFDFELRRGEVVGVVGLDGQGQDAFVRALAGVAPALQGQVRVRDRAGVFQPVRNLVDAMAGRIAYVSGDRKREGIFDKMSIFENMAMPLYESKKHGGLLGFIDWATLRAIFAREAENLLIKFGTPDDRITSLSGGNQQKVLIGRGFALRPDIIVLNDPARGIDVGAKSELYKHLRSFAESGKSVIYLSSEIEEFPGFATRVLVFRDDAPFDAFDGRDLDTGQVLTAMFGQTDGRGLTAHHGLLPSLTSETDCTTSSGSRGIHVSYPDIPLEHPIKIVETPRELSRSFDPARIRIVDFGRSRRKDRSS